MLTFQPVDAIVLAAYISGIDRLRQDIGHALLRDDAFPVTREIRQALEKAFDLRLGLETTGGITFKCFPDVPVQGGIRSQHPAAPCNLFIAVANGRIVNPVAVFHAGAHLLGDLPPVLFPLQLALRGHDRFNEFAFGRVLKPEVETLTLRTANFHFAAEPKMEFGVTRIAFEIIKNDGKGDIRLSVEERQQRHHAGTLHKVSAARRSVGEDRRDLIAFRCGILPTAGFLALQAVAIGFLVSCADPAVDDSFRGCGFGYG